MDIVITQDETCRCGREIIGVAGVCATCAREGARAFWRFVDGKMTLAQFMNDLNEWQRRLRRKEGL
jgi:hypothetical protein